jgi:hypothetical protein
MSRQNATDTTDTGLGVSKVLSGHGTALGHGTASAPGSVDVVVEEVVVRLAPDQLVELADLVAERLRAAVMTPAVLRLVDAQVVAEAIGMTAAWVREHGVELGGQRLGDGPRPRWRFDLEKAVAAWVARSSSERSQVAEALPSASSRQRRSSHVASVPDLLPIRGHQEAHRAA